MIDRRGFAGSVALGAVLASTRASAMTGFITPPDTVWTGGGVVGRAGGRLRYVTLGDKGTAPPLVLLHKLGGWVADWRDVAPALAKGRQVIAFDLPGHGASHWLGTPPAVQTVVETAGLLLGALQEMGLAQVDLAGTSLGGCVAVAMAAIAPERVRRLALPSCVLGPASTQEQVAAKEAGQASMFTPDGDPLPVDAEVARGVFGLINAERIGAEQNASRKQAGRWIRPHERGVAYTDFVSLMRRVSAPTLLLYGERDGFFLKYQAGAEAAFRDVRSIVMSGVSGFPVQDNPVDTARAIDRFLA
ncbi:alpha/beta fold hydrolase [Novosphingobium guangzhouense]|nr:alpha/beta hydrolase [Novosphingobium guangzhouense]